MEMGCDVGQRSAENRRLWETGRVHDPLSIVTEREVDGCRAKNLSLDKLF